ncbi:MAG: immunoglobulin domain-containing protein, partial [Opitutaceae bacterium]
IAIDGFNGASGTVVLNAAFTGSGGGNTPPSFVRQPASVRVQQGETVRLSAEVSGTPAPALQWTFNGAPLANGGRVSGAQSAELVITSAEAGDGGNYALGATNAAGTATSLTAVVTVDVALVRPPNDDFASRLALVGASVQTSGTNTGATAESGEPAHSSGPARRSVWWTWTAPETGAVSIDTFGSAFDTALAIYRGATLAGLAAVASNDDASGSRQSRASFTAEAGVQYAIAVDSAGADSGSITLRLLQGAAGGNPPTITRQPVNTPVLEGFGATLTVAASGGAPLAYQWWKDGTPIEGATSPTFSIDRSQLADAGSYFAVVTNPDGSVNSNTVTVTVAATGRPPNDDFASAAPVSFGGEVAVARLAGATRETGERSHGSDGSRGGTMWWRWSPFQSGQATISTEGSITETVDTLDTVLAVYTGSSLEALTLVAENDDIDFNNGDFNSELTFFATAGTTYFIAVGGYDVDDTGIIILGLPPAASNGTASAPLVLLHPLTVTLSVGRTATYVVGSAGAPNPAIRWQRSIDGGANWTDLDNGGNITGVSGLILEVTNVQEVQNGELYRARLSNSAGTVTSNPAMLTVLPRPANDDFGAAFTIPAGTGTATGNNVGATAETNEPEHAGFGQASVWWTWQANVSGPAAIDTVDSDYDTVLAVYTGTSVGGLTEIVSNDDFGDALQSRVEFTATAGTTYRIAVSGYQGDYGSIGLSVPNDLAPSLSLQPPGNTRVTNGGTVTISAGATGSPAPAFQWQRSTNGGATWANLVNDANFSGADTQILSINGAPNAFNGHLFRVVAANSLGTVTSSPTTLAVSDPSIQLLNLSTRAVSLGGDSVIIPGFVIGGTGAKRVLIRAVGPKLADLGVGDTVPDPVLSVFKHGETQALAVNDDWITQEAGRIPPATVGTQVGAFALTPSDDVGPTNDAVSAAIVLDLPAGAYSTVARDKLDRTGIGIVEVYDADDPDAGGARLVNVSNRGFVGAGPQVMIPGFVVHGSGARRYLIRAVGPKLADFGLAPGTLLANPQLSVVNGTGATIATNDDWVVQTGGTAADVQAISTQVGAFALGPAGDLPSDDQKSASLIVWLEPGNYTVLVSGANGGTGVAIAEVYEVP